MRSLSPQFVVYLLGLLLFGLFYEVLKQALGGGARFAVSAVAYVVFLRLLGWLVARALAARRGSGSR